jgi:ABC-type amino acid transport substrate-binding protein
VAALMQGDVDAVIMDNVAGIGYVGANPGSQRLSPFSLTTLLYNNRSILDSNPRFKLKICGTM